MRDLQPGEQVYVPRAVILSFRLPSLGPELCSLYLLSTEEMGQAFAGLDSERKGKAGSTRKLMFQPSCWTLTVSIIDAYRCI